MSLKSFLFLVSTFLLFVGCSSFSSITDLNVSVINESALLKEGVANDLLRKEVTPFLVARADQLLYDYESSLLDVASSGSSGIVKAGYNNRFYTLYAVIHDLPPPPEGMYYEGWLVRKGIRFWVISTGPLQRLQSNYVNVYQSGEDLTDHTFYLVTLEPQDNDPSPADHVLEGVLTKKSG